MYKIPLVGLGPTLKRNSFSFYLGVPNNGSDSSVSCPARGEGVPPTAIRVFPKAQKECARVPFHPPGGARTGWGV